MLTITIFYRDKKEETYQIKQQKFLINNMGIFFETIDEAEVFIPLDLIKKTVTVGGKIELSHN